jgi:hypothetical protein
MTLSHLFHLPSVSVIGLHLYLSLAALTKEGLAYS